MAAHASEYLSPDEYLALERQSETKHEYFDGRMVAMVGGSGPHSHIAMNSGVTLANALRGRPCKIYNSDLKVGLASLHGYAYPDVTVVCGTPEFSDTLRDVLLNPLVIVEVLSPSTEHYDRTGKFLRYQRIRSFAEYLLVEQDRPSVQLCSRQEDGHWGWMKVEGLEAMLTIPSLGCAIALADIYNNVDFAGT